MIIRMLRHRSRLWDVVVHIEAARSRDCSLQRVFVARDAQTCVVRDRLEREVAAAEAALT